MSAITEAAAPTGRERRIAPLNAACFGCGPDNRSGLRLEFRALRDGVAADWTPTQAWQSFEGVVHGGVIATALDEAMSKAIVARGWEAFTAELRVRYRRQVAPGEHVRVTGCVLHRQKRLIRAEAWLNTPSGEERARAWGTFLVPPGASN